MPTRIKLQVLEVKAVEQVGANNIPKLNFKAQANNQEAWFFTFKQDLFEHIRPQAVIDAEVEITDSPDGRYVNRKITQLYGNDGKPLSRKYQKGKSEGEMIFDARAVALDKAVKLAAAGRIEMNDVESSAEKFFTWLRTGKWLVEMPKVNANGTQPIQIITEPRNAGELAKWAAGHGVDFNTTWICRNLGLNKLSELDTVEKVQEAKDNLMKITKWRN